MNQLISAWLICFATIFPIASFASTPLPKLQNLAPALKTQNPRLKQIYNDALKNLDQQFTRSSDGTIYVSTGDIKAEWLRDSSVQVRPFLFFAKSNRQAAELVKGVIIRQARYILLDPYANAFYENYTIHERKFELDSLTNPILLAWTYWKVTGDSTVFTPEVWSAFKLAVRTMINEQDHARNSKYTHPHLSNNPTAVTGLIWTGFRPSDDRCKYNYLIPAEAMAAQALRALIEISATVMRDKETTATATKLEKEVSAAIAKYGVARTRDGETVYAYEVDGLGHAIAMDDANLPSLMSLPIYGYLDAKDPLYQTTRARSLTTKNPFYFAGEVLAGIGSPHTPRDMVWPLSLLAQAMTSTTSADFDIAIRNLIRSSYGTSGLHESVHVNNPAKFTRADFGWPNAMFIELALTKWNSFKELPKVER